MVDVTAGGPEAEPFDIPDADPVGGAGSSEPPPATSPGPSAAASPTPVGGAVPGGVDSGELPGIFRQDLTPIVLLLSLLTAALLGVGHALTPGHGKTLMAAYLVGTRGTPLHAVGLGLSVSLSHTLGVLVLAALVLGASDVLPADVVVRWAPVVAAVSIAAIGGWMLIGELRRRRAVGRARALPRDGRAHTHDEHGHEHEHEHEAGSSAGPDTRPDDGSAHDHGLEHSHGGVAHSHAPVPGSTITWRSLFALGLAGGLIPSTSALLILLGSIAAGRPAFGFVLVVAFGLGMAAVMIGIGLALVAARDQFDRMPGGGLDRIREAVPLVAAVVVLGFGLYLTVQALAAAPTALRTVPRGPAGGQESCNECEGRWAPLSWHKSPWDPDKCARGAPWARISARLRAISAVRATSTAIPRTVQRRRRTPDAPDRRQGAGHAQMTRSRRRGSGFPVISARGDASACSGGSVPGLRPVRTLDVGRPDR